MVDVTPLDDIHQRANQQLETHETNHCLPKINSLGQLGLNPGRKLDWFPARMRCLCVFSVVERGYWCLVLSPEDLSKARSVELLGTKSCLWLPPLSDHVPCEGPRRRLPEAFQDLQFFVSHTFPTSGSKVGFPSHFWEFVEFGGFFHTLGASILGGFCVPYLSSSPLLGLLSHAPRKRKLKKCCEARGFARGLRGGELSKGPPREPEMVR